MPAKKSTAPDHWPLGEYLRGLRGRMSIREVARLADVSESRVRQIESGRQNVPGGMIAPVNPRPETLAAICVAIGADMRKAFKLAGLNIDAYPWLIDEPVGVVERDRKWFTDLPRKEREEVLSELQRLHVDTELRNRSSRGQGSRRSG